MKLLIQKKINIPKSSISKSQVNKIINEYLKSCKNSLLYDLIERIEITENKQINLHFKFSELNAIQNL